MSRFYEKEYKMRKAAKSGHETTINPLWVADAGVDGMKVLHIFDGIYVLVPPDIILDKKKLREAVKYRPSTAREKEHEGE